jgi:hypothetical protein
MPGCGEHVRTVASLERGMAQAVATPDCGREDSAAGVEDLIRNDQAILQGL